MAAKAEALVVEGKKKRVGDDDPTMMMVREEGKPKPDPRRAASASGAKTPAPDEDEDVVVEPSGGRGAIESARRHQGGSAEVGGAARREAGMSGRLMVAIAVLLLAGATGVGLYFSGVLK